MSFNPKPNKPDSKDAAKLRSEYADKVRQFQESRDPASKTKLREDKEKAFQKLVTLQTHERRETLAAHHKVLIGMGKMKSAEQVKAERAQAEAQRVARVANER